MTVIPRTLLAGVTFNSMYPTSGPADGTRNVPIELNYLLSASKPSTSAVLVEPEVVTPLFYVVYVVNAAYDSPTRERAHTPSLHAHHTHTVPFYTAADVFRN